MLLVLHVGRWSYWFGVKREWPWPLGWGKDRGDSIALGLTFEIV